MGICESMHPKALHMPKSPRGIVHALSTTADDLRLEALLSLQYERIAQNPSDGITQVEFISWMMDTSEAAYTESMLANCFTTMHGPQKETRIGRGMVLDRPTWCNAENARRIGDNVFPGWQKLWSIMVEADSESEVAQQLSLQESWVAANRIISEQQHVPFAAKPTESGLDTPRHNETVPFEMHKGTFFQNLPAHPEGEQEAMLVTVQRIIDESVNTPLHDTAVFKYFRINSKARLEA